MGGVIMEQDRRTFLKTSALAGAATVTGAAATLPAVPAAAQTRPLVEPREMARGLTLATLRKGGAYSLGMRTDRGILDVAAAEADLREARQRPSRPCSTVAAPQRCAASTPRRAPAPMRRAITSP